MTEDIVEKCSRSSKLSNELPSIPIHRSQLAHSPLEEAHAERDNDQENQDINDDKTLEISGLVQRVSPQSVEDCTDDLPHIPLSISKFSQDSPTSDSETAPASPALSYSLSPCSSPDFKSTSSDNPYLPSQSSFSLPELELNFSSTITEEKETKENFSDTKPNQHSQLHPSLHELLDSAHFNLSGVFQETGLFSSIGSLVPR